jgi:hypothetical protein
MPPIVTEDYYDNVLIKPTMLVYHDSYIFGASFLIFTIDGFVSHNLFGPSFIFFKVSLPYEYEFGYYGTSVSYEELKNIKLKNRIKERNH